MDNPNNPPGYPYWVSIGSARLSPGVTGFDSKCVKVLCVQSGVMKAYISDTSDGCLALAQADYPLQAFEGPRPADPTDAPAGGGPVPAAPIGKPPGITIRLPLPDGTYIEIIITLPLVPPDGSYGTSRF